MKTISLILLLSGSSTRYNQDSNKVLYKINNQPLFMYSLNSFSKVNLSKIILVIRKEDEQEIKDYLNSTDFVDKITYIYGGNTRRESVQKGLKEVTTDYVLIHDGARPCINDFDIKNLINQTINNNYLVSYLGSPTNDTLRKQEKDTIVNIDRTNVYNVSTPQMFNKELYDVILNNKDDITDEVSLFTNQKVLEVNLTKPNPKLTYHSDLEYISYLLTNQYEYLIGNSMDYHPFGNEGKLILGGIVFDNYPKLQAWSDGDVVYHAVAESIMGALSLGDLGTFFPDNDEKNKNLDSKELLLFVKKQLENTNSVVGNIDITVYAEQPKLKEYKKDMIENLKKVFDCDLICVKAATLNTWLNLKPEKGIGVSSSVLIKRKK